MESSLLFTGTLATLSVLTCAILAFLFFEKKENN